MNWKRWNWLDGLALPLAMTVLRGAWVWLWLRLAQHFLSPSHPEAALPAWLIALLLLGSILITRQVVGRVETLARARLIIAGLGLALMFLVVWWRLYQGYAPWDLRWLEPWSNSMLFWRDELPPSVLVFVAFVYLWLRGILDGQRPLAHSDVRAAFFGSSLALVVALAAARLVPQGLPLAVGPLVLLFFATAMMALALTGLKAGRTPGLGRLGESRFPINRYWVGSVLAVIAVVLGLALLLSALIAPQLAAQIISQTWAILGELLLLLIKITSLILYPILYLMSILLAPLLRAILGFFRGRDEVELESEGGPGGSFFDILPGTAEEVPPEFRLLGLFLFILFVALIFAFALRRLLAENEDEGVEETRELIFSRDLLLAQLSGLWPSWWRHAEAEPAAVVTPFLSLDSEPQSRRIIRQVYQSLLLAARRQDKARRRHQTPAEYEESLCQNLPGAQKSMRVITEQYMQARYSADPPTAEQARRTQQAWAELERRLRHTDNDAHRKP